MIFLVIVLTVCLVSGRSLLMKAASDKENSLPQILVIFTVATFSSTLLGLVGEFTLHRSTMILAVLYGTFNFLSQYLNLKAMSVGMTTRVIFICSCNFLVSSIYSIIIFHERVTPFRITGILLICVAQVCFCFGSKAENQNSGTSHGWLFYAITSMFFSGIVSIVQKYMRISPLSG